MRRIIYSFILLFACVFVGQAQISNWQGVLRSADNKPIVDQDVRLRLTINQGGSSVYSEIHQTKTSKLGLMNVQVCNGTSSTGSCTTIDPTKGAISLKIELDDKGGTNFKDFGSSEISQSFYSQWAENVVNDAVNDADADPKNEIQTISKQGDIISLSHNGGSIEVMSGGGADADADSTNELQMISIQGNLLTISDGNTIKIPRSGSDADFDPSNELQSLFKIGDIIELRQGARKFGSVTDKYIDDDADPANELQELSFNNTVLTLSDGGAVDLVSLQKPASDIWKETNNSVWWDHNAGSKYEFGLGRADFLFGSNSEKRYKAGSNNVHETYKFRPSDFPGVEFEEGMDMLEHPTAYIQNYHWITDANKKKTESYYVKTTMDNNGGITSRMFLKSNFKGTTTNGIQIGADGYGSIFLMNPHDANKAKAGFFVDKNGKANLFAQVKNSVETNPSNEDQEIWYASLEGPEAAIYERGTTKLIDGNVSVDFSQHFVAMAGTKYTVILTPMSADSKGLAVVKKSKDGFEVQELFKGEGTYSFDWEVKAVRKGYEDYKVIRQKQSTTVEKLSSPPASLVR